MATSRIPATIDALVASWRTITGLNVIDGPLVTSPPRECVYVGYDADAEGEFTTAEPQQEWAGIGTRKRDQEFDVICAVVVLVGDSNPKIARDRAYTVAGSIEDKLRADPGLGMPANALPFMAEYREGISYTEPTSGGWQVRVLFTVHVKTRI